MSSPQTNLYADDPVFGTLWQHFADLGYDWEAYGDCSTNHKVFVRCNGQTKAVGFAHELAALPKQRLADLLSIYFPDEQRVRWIEASDKYMRLKSAACKVAHDLDGCAYFVGSALTSLTRPRDVDVRIILTNHDFETRYHLPVPEWQWQATTCDWKAERWAWYDEQERYRVKVSHACGERTVDLGILPESLWNAVYASAPHERWGAWAPGQEALNSIKRELVREQ